MANPEFPKQDALLDLNNARFYMDYHEKNPFENPDVHLQVAESRLINAQEKGLDITPEYQRLENLFYKRRTKRLHGDFFN